MVNVLSVDDTSKFKPTYDAKNGDWDEATKLTNTLLSVNCTEWNEATCIAGEYNAHYLIGRYYQYNTAVAGTGNQHTDSICPKGWELPLNDTANNKNYYNLFSQYLTLDESGTASNSSEVAIKPPFYFVSSGETFARKSNATWSLSGWAWYWSAGLKNGLFTRLAINSGKILTEYADASPLPGISIRCVSR